MTLLITLLWRKNRPLLLGGICIVLSLCSDLRYGAVPTGDELQPYIGKETVAVTGVVVEEPEPRDSSTKLILSAREINGQEVSGTVLVRTTRYPAYENGDLLRVTGELEEPSEDLDGFDYRAYLARQGIYSAMYYPDVEREESGQGSQPFQAIYSFKHQMGEALGTSLSAPQGSLAQGILPGLRHNIPSPLYQDFRNSGTAHLLAISGLHSRRVAMNGIKPYRDIVITLFNFVITFCTHIHLRIPLQAYSLMLHTL